VETLYLRALYDVVHWRRLFFRHRDRAQPRWGQRRSMAL